jgi:hypothetical protein
MSWVLVFFVHSMLSARCFSLNRLVAVTLPQVVINDKKKIYFSFDTTIARVKSTLILL